MKCAKLLLALLLLFLPLSSATSEERVAAAESPDELSMAYSLVADLGLKAKDRETAIRIIDLLERYDEKQSAKLIEAETRSKKSNETVIAMSNRLERQEIGLLGAWTTAGVFLILNFCPLPRIAWK